MRLTRYRRLGADPPFGDPRRAHGVAMEGYFWRLSDPESGRVIVALCGLCGDWATVALAAHPGGFLRWADLGGAGGDPAALGVWAGTGFRGDVRGVSVDLGPGARLRVDIQPEDPAPEATAVRHPAFGGSGVAHAIPGLSQYWHPHVLGGRATGTAQLDGETAAIDGWQVYAEKNWGRGGFPGHWWWGQAQGFERRDVAVAFAGGEVRIGPARVDATAVVVGLGDRRIRLGNPLLAPARVQADGAGWSLRARGPVWSVAIEGRARPADAHLLPVPDLAARRGVPAAHEHLAGALTLVVRRRGQVAFAGSSALAGLEVGAAGAPGKVGE